MLFCYQMKMFYLWSLRHIIVLILSHAACFLHPKLKCSCSPYAFFLENIAASPLLSNVQILLCSFAPSDTLPSTCSSEMPHKSKGSSSCLVSSVIKDTGVSAAAEGDIFLHTWESGVWGEGPGGPRKHHTKKWPSRSSTANQKRAADSLLIVLRMWYYPYMR